MRFWIFFFTLEKDPLMLVKRSIMPNVSDFKRLLPLMELFVSHQLLLKSKLSCVSLKMRPSELIWKNERSVQWLRENKGGFQLSVENICTKVFKFNYLHVNRHLTSRDSWWGFSIWFSCPLMGISCQDTRVFKTLGLVWRIWDKTCKTCALWRVRGRVRRTPWAISEVTGCLCVENEANPALRKGAQGGLPTQRLPMETFSKDFFSIIGYKVAILL